MWEQWAHGDNNILHLVSLHVYICKYRCVGTYTHVYVHMCRGHCLECLPIISLHLIH